MTDPTHAPAADAGTDHPSAAEAELAAGFAAARAEVDRLTEENRTLRDQTLRALADAENVRRRAERERDDTAKYAVANLARDVLSVADNLQRALQAVPPEARATNETLGALLDGVEATERELLQVFERRAIKRVDPLGERFDPNFHQAMFEVEHSGQPAGTVVQVLQAGYVLHDRLLRPALVGVAKADPNAAGGVDTKA